MIRAVIDANVLFSATIIARGIPYDIFGAWQNQQFSLISSERILVELQDNLRDPKQAAKYNLTEEDIQATITLVRTQSEFIAVPASEIRNITGDDEDDTVLATGRLAHAEYLVTGDRGLLDLGEYEGMKIITPRQFVQLLQS
jgi:putative PIN family toxin of toxin-antitoxin system